MPLPKDHPQAGRLVRHPGRWVFDQASALVNHSNWRVTVFTLVKGAEADYKKSFGALDVVYLKAQSRLRTWTLFKADIRALCRRAHQVGADLVHAHGTEDAYARAAQRTGLPYVVTVQGLYAECNKKEKTSWLSPARVIEFLERRFFRSVNRAIVKSDHISELLKRHYPQVETIIIPNTISRAFTQQRDGPKVQNRIAYVGSVIPRKGFHLLRQALEKIDPSDPFEVHIYGIGGETEYSNSEVAAIERKGHFVVNHGNVDEYELARELSISNYVVAPSFSETFGNQVIEGMMCLCHCIVTEDTGMAENVRKYGCGTVVPQLGAAEISRALETQRARGLGADVLGERMEARMKVLDALGEKRVSAELEKIYNLTLKHDQQSVLAEDTVD